MVIFPDYIETNKESTNKNVHETLWSRHLHSLAPSARAGVEGRTLAPARTPVLAGGARETIRGYSTTGYVHVFLT
jgi:hypothetical protein